MSKKLLIILNILLGSALIVSIFYYNILIRPKAENSPTIQSESMETSTDGKDQLAKLIILYSIFNTSNDSTDSSTQLARLIAIDKLLGNEETGSLENLIILNSLFNNNDLIGLEKLLVTEKELN